MKNCPYCAEEIQDDAIVCRFCGRDLNAEGKQKAQVKKNRIMFIILAVLLGISTICIILYLVGTNTIAY